MSENSWDQTSTDTAFADLYPELRRLARRERFRMGRPTSLETTSLIHEAWLKLGGGSHWNDRRHFLCAAALTMRRLLVDAARARLRLKRNPGARVTLPKDDLLSDATMPDETLVSLGVAVDRLTQIDPRLASVVECRFFAGYTEAETAEALGVNERTVRRDWTKAKAWLFREISA